MECLGASSPIIISLLPELTSTADPNSEFFFLLSHAIFDPSFCLFEHTEKGNYTLQFNPNSSINPEHLDYFQFVGRAVGLAIYHRRFLDAHFATSIYKLALGRPVGLEDMAMIDADMHQSLTWMK